MAEWLDRAWGSLDDCSQAKEAGDGSIDLEDHRHELRTLCRVDHEGADPTRWQVKTVKVGEALIAYDQREIAPTDIVHAVNEVG